MIFLIVLNVIIFLNDCDWAVPTNLEKSSSNHVTTLNSIHNSIYTCKPRLFRNLLTEFLFLLDCGKFPIGSTVDRHKSKTPHNSNNHSFCTKIDKHLYRRYDISYSASRSSLRLCRSHVWFKGRLESLVRWMRLFRCLSHRCRELSSGASVLSDPRSH